MNGQLLPEAEAQAMTFSAEPDVRAGSFGPQRKEMLVTPVVDISLKP